MKNAAHIARQKSQERSRRDELIKKYAYLAKLSAHRLAMRLPPSVNVDDLISAGIMGLLDAIDKFDEGRGVKFRTYAEFRIRGAMLDELRSMDWVPRSVRKKVQEIEKAVVKVEKRENRPADAEEIALELGVDMETYQAMLSKAGGIELVSLDEPLWGNDNTKDRRRTHVDLLQDGGDPNQDLMQSEFQQVLAQSIGTLSEKEQQILSLYYKEELTLKEVGEVMGLTESRICQIHTQCMIKLRAKLKAQEARM
ncbi:MAG: FliA/WhiG family RNA polymerase sigma factor [Desulfatibacillum sp.]|nr:FliA/WhiG family RNA polymerase sigma factor [Desulfatibacillum sp.]